MGCPIVELGRIRPASGVKLQKNVPPLAGDLATLLVYNPLTAPIYFRFGGGADPTAIEHDVAVPGSSHCAIPVDPGVTRITAVVIYPGAVPVGDVADAVIRVTSAQLPLAVGALT